jgi:putative transcriptional regulator
MKNKRNIRGELIEGLGEIREHYDGKITLRSHKLTKLHLPEMTGEELRRLREELNLSQAVMARLIFTALKTIQAWERKRDSRIDNRAAALALLAKRRPEIIRDLEEIAGR